ncbi:hypothetical protein [Photobacterium nomapromontoriensis]|uniref:hypothetical protein n=1 Tax=Photobacterium nomapromontoriensis TaxID=2910237 RepID=UPI003D134E5B
MKTEITCKSQILTQSHCWLSEGQEQQLLPLIARCFKGVSPDIYYEKYFLQPDAFERKLKLIYCDNELVGYCLLTFKRLVLNGQSTIIVGASAGFLPEQRHGNQTVMFSIVEAAKCYLKHPKTAIYYADTMISPAMYRVMAKLVAEIYPNPERRISPESAPILQYLQQTAMVREDHWHPHLCFVNRYVNYTSDDIERLTNSEKLDIQYYLSINPKFTEGYGIVTVIPVNIKNIFGTMMNYLRQR